MKAFMRQTKRFTQVVAVVEAVICTPVGRLVIVQGSRLKAEAVAGEFSQMRTEQKAINSLWNELL